MEQKAVFNKGWIACPNYKPVGGFKLKAFLYNTIQLGWLKRSFSFKIIKRVFSIKSFYERIYSCLLTSSSLLSLPHLDLSYLYIALLDPILEKFTYVLQNQKLVKKQCGIINLR
jgi:hypothetical protein